MKRNFSLLLALSAVILSSGCKKNLPAFVESTKPALAGFPSNPSWNLPNPTSRLIRFDIDDGNGSSCLLSYDINTNKVELTQVIGTTGTTLWTSYNGLPLTGGGSLSVIQYSEECTDNFNEVGGVHIISFDAGGTGHEDHLLVYIPGTGYLWLLSYSNGVFNTVWQSNGNGIAGYDLKGYYDKIISYDYGSGSKNALICYRPGNQFFWVIQNIGTGNSPIWYNEVKSSGGVGGFDLKGTMDQMIAVGNTPTAMDLCLYRPSYGYVWYLNHTAYSTNWTAYTTSRNGFNANPYSSPFNELQDRMIASNTTGTTSDAGDHVLTAYRPGGLNASIIDWSVYGGLFGAALSQYGVTYNMPANPYANPYNYIGDHILAFSGNGQGNTSLCFYTNSNFTPTQIYEFNTTTHEYTQVY